jgi:phytoene dehydrogenase-like protein
MAGRYDAIVIGAGLGGLTAAALLARTGRKILVLERSDDVGGAATVYRHGPLVVEASLHEIDGLEESSDRPEEDEPKLPLVRSLGLERDLAFVAVPDMYEVRGGPVGAPFVFPNGIAAAEAAVVARFPQHADAVARYFAALSAVREAAAFAYGHIEDRGWWLRQLPEAASRLWPLIGHGQASVAEVMASLFGSDEAVKCALAANLGYYADDPDKLSFLSFAAAQGSFLAGGGHYVRGGARRLSQRLVELVREAAGEVETGRAAQSLLLDGERVAGVVHRNRAGGDARVAYASVVLGNAAPSVLAEMLPQTQREAFKAKYARKALSISLWVVSVGLARPAASFGVAHYTTALLPDWMTALADFRLAAGLMADPAGERLPPFGLADYAAIDSGLADGPPYGCSLSGTDRLDAWEGLDAAASETRKEAWMNRLIARVDQEFPGFAGAVLHREMATAATMQHTLNTPGGAVYGFAPESFANSIRTPVRGLYLASAWGMGGGFTGAMLGGAAAAREVVRTSSS